MVTIRNHNVILDSEFTNTLNPKVLYELGKMRPENQIKFQASYLKTKRSLGLAYICLLFFPGTHYAFLNRWQLQIVFWATLGGGLLWWLTDFYRLPNLVKQTNIYNQQKILREINSVSIFKGIPPIRVTQLSAARVA